MIDWTNWTDSNGFIRPDTTSAITGNGVLYSSIKRIFGFNPTKDICWYKKGCLKRDPENTFGQESFDDYLGVAVASIYSGNTEYARSILWYGLTHLFFFCNGPFAWAAFLGRYPAVWFLMFAGAFPKLKFLVHIPLFVAQQFQVPGPIASLGSSPLQLQWLFQKGYVKLYGENKSYTNWAAQVDMTEVFSAYYQLGHPFIGLVSK